MSIAAVLPAAAQGLPTSKVYGWGAIEGWIHCGSPMCHESPVAVEGLRNVIALDASDASNLAIRSNGTVWAWGYNGYGELGDGTTKTSARPVKVSGLSNVVATATGNSFALALRSNGTVWAWGNNTDGQLGNGTRSDYSTIPVRVPGLSNVTAVAAGGNKGIALLSNGRVKAWGLNEDGELGDGSTQKVSTTPVSVKGLRHVVSISSGNLFADALLSNGRVKSWGNNAFGQLGNGTTRNSSVPVPVTGLSNVAQVSAGGDAPSNGQNMALLDNGRVMAWGDNADGQLGNGTTTNSSVPVHVKSLSHVQAIAAGGLHGMALLSNGELMTWGSNIKGQLGNDTTKESNTPIEVLSNCELISAGALDSLAALAPST